MQTTGVCKSVFGVVFVYVNGGFVCFPSVANFANLTASESAEILHVEINSGNKRLFFAHEARRG